MAKPIYPEVERKRADLGTPKAHMARKLGISEQALTNKMDGTSEFSAREILMLAEWWNMSADALMAGAKNLEREINNSDTHAEPAVGDAGGHRPSGRAL